MKHNFIKTPDMMFKTVTLIATLITAAALCFSVFSSGNGKHDRPNSAARPNEKSSVITVIAIQLEPESIENTIKINGDISSKSEVDVFPDTAGKVTRIEITEGTYVQKGTVLMYVDPSKPGSSYAASPVKSPVSGTVTDIPVTIGSTITTNGTAAVIGSLDDLEITISVAEKYSAFLNNGEKAYISLNAIPDAELGAHVTSVSPVVNKNTRTFSVKLELNSYDSRIKPGMFCTVRLVLQKADNAMVVPKTSLSTYNAESVIYIVDANNTAQRRTIVCGMENDSYVQIIDGVSFGDMVITAGSVTSGSSVRFSKQ